MPLVPIIQHIQSVSLCPQSEVYLKKALQDVTDTVKLSPTQLDETIGDCTSTQEEEDESVSTIYEGTSTSTPESPPSSPEPHSSYDATDESDTDRDDDDAYTPGPFMLLHDIRYDTSARVVAVRDMDNGRALSRRGRPMCMKIIPRSMDDIIVRELTAYKALYKASVDDWAPYVMRLEASLREHDHLFFIMELMDCDLMDVLQSWDLYRRKIHRRKWVAQLTTGLAALHSAGIIHRDIKPENIFVDFRFNVRIGDLGCSYIHPRGKAISRLGGYSYDVTGTWPYQAPEMLRNDDFPLDKKKKYSLQVDYWALGLIIFELEQNVDFPVCLFNDKNDLRKYINYRPVRREGQSYLTYRGFDNKISPSARSLIMGLIHPIPDLRFDHTRVRAHPYFSGRNGDKYSEFHDIEKHGKYLNSIPIGSDVPIERSKHRGARDVFFPIMLGPNECIGVNHTWINPLGHWGTPWGNL